MSALKTWFNTYFSDPEALVLLSVLIVFFGVIIYLGNIFAPVIAAIVIAYLLEGLGHILRQKCKCPDILAMATVYTLFIATIVFLLLWLLPLLSQQLSQLIEQLPSIFSSLQNYLIHFPKAHPNILPKAFISDIQSLSLNNIQFSSIGKWVLNTSVSSLSSIVSWLIYLILVPMMVLFFIKDKSKILNWCSNIFPTERQLSIQVFKEVKIQLGKYLRGKCLEMIIVGLVTYIGFICFGLKYAPLLAVFVGLSVFIPYVGMVLVTIPVAVVGLVQFGVTPDFFYMFAVYLIIQALDGNVLVPLLYSGAVDLHPVAIIISILFFGGIWGFWGLFFAIPLATLVRAVVVGWYRHCK